MGGFSTKYGQSSSSQKVGAKKQKNKKGTNKQTWNDGRAPDVISKLVTRKKDTTTVVPKLLTKSFFEGPKYNIPDVNTPAVARPNNSKGFHTIPAVFIFLDDKLPIWQKEYGVTITIMYNRQIDGIATPQC
jgi:hypothetical protein